MTPYPDALKARALELFATVRRPSGGVPGYSTEDVRADLKREFGTAPSARLISQWAAAAKRVDNRQEPEEPLTYNADDAENRKLKQLLQEQKALIKSLTEKADFVSEVTRSIEAHVRSAPAIIIPDKPIIRPEHDMTAMGIFNDWHDNEYVSRKRFMSYLAFEQGELEESFNEFNLEISERRIRYAHREILREILSKPNPKVVTRVILVYDGDLTNGDIHAANVTNCIGSNAAASRLADIVSEENLAFRKHLPWAHIEVIFKVGNHGRINVMTKSPNAKLVEENYDWTVGEMVRKTLKNQTNLTVENDPTLFSLRKIYGKNHLFYHGHGIKGGGGISKLPLFGIAKFVYEQMVQLLNLNVPVHHIHLGHWHQHYEGEYGLGTVTIGRSLIGQTERGAELGYSGKTSQRIVWLSPARPNGKSYMVDIPADPDPGSV